MTFHAFLAFYGFLCVFGLAIGWALGHRPSAMLATLGVFALLVTLPLGVGSLLDPELTRSDFFVADGALVVALALAEMGVRLRRRFESSRLARFRPTRRTGQRAHPD